MAIYLVQNLFGQENNVAAFQTNTLVSPTTVGNTLVAVVSSFKTGAADPAIAMSSSPALTWSTASAVQSTAGGARVYIFYAPITTGSSGHTITATANATAFVSLEVFEFHGLLYPGTPLDQATGGVGSSTAGNTGSVTTSTRTELFVAGASVDTAAITFNTGNNFIKVDQVTTGQNLYNSYKVGGPQTTSGVFTWNSTTAWAANIATFQSNDGVYFNNRGLRPHAFSPGLAR